MAYDRRTITGGVPATTLGSGIDSSTLTITIADATGWPTGSAGDFAVVIDRGTASEEKVLVDTRSGTTLTVVSGGRGIDGTTGVSHSSGAAIEHCLLARDLDEANAHIADTNLDHHTQYLSEARHDVEARHTFGAAYGTPAAAADISTAASAGSGNNPAREDHVHKIGSGAINSSGMLASGVVGATALASDAVTTAKILDANVTTGKIADDAITAAKIAADAVTTAKILDANVTTGKIADDAITAAKITDAVVTMAKIASEAGTDYTPTLTGVTLGTGGTKYGRYFKFGRLVVGVAGFTLGTSGDVTTTIQVSLPVAAGTTGADWIFAARGYDASASQGATGIGVIIDGESVGKNIVTIGVNFWGSVSGTVPFDWANGDTFRSVFLYEAAS